MTATYTVGWNYAGYLPENPPEVFPSFHEAKLAMYDLIKHEAAHGDTEDYREQCEAAAVRTLELEEIDDYLGETVFPVEFWIQIDHTEPTVI